MEAAKKPNDVMTSAAAFVEGGVQEACDDACSICLENFSSSDPSTVTNCKHEFHLQCILEWGQRSSNCPMCWQPISFRDATSQQLLEAVEEERTLQSYRLRNGPIFHHPRLVDFELQHLPVGASEVDLEDRIFQHLAAAIGRGHHRTFRREDQGNRSSSQGERPFFIFSTPNAPVDNAVGSESVSYRNSVDDQVPSVSPRRPQTRQASGHRVGPSVASVDQQRISPRTSFASRSSQVSQETGEQSDLHSLSESLKSRLNTWSMRYKESISRNTRGWKERLFSRNTSMSDVGTEVRREVHAGLSRLMERLDARENVGTERATGTSNSSSRSKTNNVENHTIRTREV
ncbi:hypothetical protein RND81_08G163300 [Saponaria officinalis]|uniref:RING-type E3 ubiquitin transferase n=1 Tax=Saponaria officinalis TaxID=3572 RepID=A0AAW1J9P8_SAPOF